MDLSAPFIIIALFILYNVLPPFIIGIALKGFFRKKNINQYIPFVLSVAIGITLFLINGKSPAHILGSNILGLIFFVLIYTLFINAGIKTYTEFVKGLK